MKDPFELLDIVGGFDRFLRPQLDAYIAELRSRADRMDGGANCLLWVRWTETK